MEHPLDGILEKLKRADQNIINLNSEITDFIEAGKDTVFPNDNDQAFQDAVKKHGDREVPLRFSVLAGEIVHHFRSCLDHLVWLLSSEQYRADFPNRIEFPIFAVEPTRKEEIARYDGKIKGITSPKAKATINAFQPYKRLAKGEIPENDPLCIVHDMDRFDKHRELVLAIPSIGMTVTAETIYKFAILKEKADATPNDWKIFDSDMHVNSKFSPQISFRQFGKGENEAVIPGLRQLGKYVGSFIALFGDEFK